MLLRRDLYTVAILIAVANAMAKPIVFWWVDGDPVNPIAALCSLAALWFWRKSNFDDRCLAHDCFAFMFAGILICLPFAMFSWLALCILALGLGFRATGAQGVVAVLLVASIRTPLAEMIMAILAEPLLLLDGALAGFFAQLFGIEISVQGNMVVGDNGHAVYVMSGCASFANISDALLIWFACSVFFGCQLGRRLTTVAILLCLTILFVNTVRLGVMAISADLYEWVHDGTGKTLVQLVLIFVTSGAVFASLRLQEEQTSAA